MSANENADVIVFDNLVRPSDVVGKYVEVRALQIDPDHFPNPNATGTLRQFTGLSEIRECAASSGRRFKAAMHSE